MNMWICEYDVMDKKGLRHLTQLRVGLNLLINYYKFQHNFLNTIPLQIERLCVLKTPNTSFWTAMNSFISEISLWNVSQKD